MKYLFAFLLTLSLTTNVLLIRALYFSENGAKENSEIEVSITTDKALNPENYKTSSDSFSSTPSKNKVTSDKEVVSSIGDAQWDRLQYLRGSQRYEELLVEVREYLRAYPANIDAVLLEAEAIYHTQPLNAAIVHYYGLKDVPMAAHQKQEVEKFIEIHSSKIIQQFSGDGHWHLLAAFLEPLLQVDPTNRAYIYSLAQSYGMDEHFGLMEDTLAALPSNDIRAERLRNNIYAMADNKDAPLDPVTDTNLPLQDANTDNSKVIALTRIDNQLFADVDLDREQLRLLVDTGASVTALPKSLEEKVKRRSEYLGLFNVQTAGGMISSPMYKLSSLYLGNTELTNVTVMLLDDNNLGNYQGLLGMNVLSKFDFVASKASGTVGLRLIR
ncbi:retropepsin-like aspartic protease family protein [Glaciecola sp. 1036]|uniref:retropepsin-like aspartic protease family protein n=1 Tax=Alteromonadaceae TaxID=72275 RepID=UPI003D06D989